LRGVAAFSILLAIGETGLLPETPETVKGLKRADHYYRSKNKCLQGA